MSEVMWRDAQGERFRQFIRAQDCAFQHAMRQEMLELRRDALRLTPVARIVEPVPSAEYWRQIVSEVAVKHKVTWQDLYSHRRDRATTAARHEAWYRLRHETTMTFPQIARKFGGRDHTTIMAGVKKHAERIGAAA